MPLKQDTRNLVLIIIGYMGEAFTKQEDCFSEAALIIPHIKPGTRIQLATPLPLRGPGQTWYYDVPEDDQ